MTSTLGIKKIQYPNGTNIATLDSSGSIAFAGASTVAGTLGVTGAITGTLATAAQTNITSVGTLTSFRSTGIDDNADAVALTIDNGENVAIGVTSKNSSNNGSLTIGHTGMTKITGSANGNADELVLIGADASANVGMSIISNNANIGGIFFGDEDDTDIGRIEYYHSDNSMRFQTNTAERMRINSNGNVGIGVVPETTWHSSRYALQLGLGASIFGDTTATGCQISANTVSTLGSSLNGYKYINSDKASTYQQYDGQHNFRVASSGSADGAITWNTALTINNSGNVLVGLTARLFYNHTGTINVSAAGDSGIKVNRSTDTGNFIAMGFNGTQRGQIGSDNSHNIYLASQRGAGIAVSDQELIPTNAGGTLTDNFMDVGHPSYRFDDVRATNGTIQTSDRNDKQDIEELTDAEKRVAVVAKGLMRKFRWKDKVAEKGDNARTHFGIIAQDLEDAFKAESLDASKYAMFCSDTWTNEDGSEQTRLGVRYSELLAFIISAI